MHEHLYVVYGSFFQYSTIPVIINNQSYRPLGEFLEPGLAETKILTSGFLKEIEVSSTYR